MQNSQQIFKLHSEYQPTGDQPQAIEKLVKGFQEGNQCETLLGVTGSGKTFTMANVIAQLNKPTLIIAHNKTLAAQLYGEFKEFFPENAVEYFVSYYDYYQPEAYVPSSDTYIAKDSARNDEIDKLRLSATSALSERNDVIVVSSVSCIYGIGSPKDYMEMIISLRPGMEKDRDDVIRQLIDIQYDRNDMDFQIRHQIGQPFGPSPSLSKKSLIHHAFSNDNPRYFGNSRIFCNLQGNILTVCRYNFCPALLCQTNMLLQPCQILRCFFCFFCCLHIQCRKAGLKRLCHLFHWMAKRTDTPGYALFFVFLFPTVSPRLLL